MSWHIELDFFKVIAIVIKIPIPTMKKNDT